MDNDLLNLVELDIDSVKDRFMANETLFTFYLYSLEGNECFSNAQAAYQSGSVKETFDWMHDLKGLVANLSIGRLEKPVNQLVEVLRANQMPDQGEWDFFVKEYEEALKIIAQMKEKDMCFFS